jgi:hypothetical protein
LSRATVNIIRVITLWVGAMASNIVKTITVVSFLMLINSAVAADGKSASISSYVGKSIDCITQEGKDTSTTLSLPMDTSIISASLKLTGGNTDAEDAPALSTVIRDDDDDIGLQLDLSIDPDNADVVVPKVRFKFRGAYRTYKPKKTYRLNEDIDVFIEFKPENKVAELTLSGHSKPLYIPFWDKPSSIKFDCQHCQANHVINRFERFQQ